jgi:neuron navigator 2
MNSRQNSFSGLASRKQQGPSSMMAAPQTAKQPKSIIEIYTDWANHYLDKLRGCSRIKDLQTELSDGLVLSDVIEGVTGTKVPDVQRKPKNNPQVQTSQYN